MNYDKTSPHSIYEYSKKLIGHTLREMVEEEKLHARLGKGGLGQLVEELFFEYKVNNDQRADFAEANLELKCTPLKRLKNEDLAIKERLVCTMIDYFDVVDIPFSKSKLYHKCYLMLILFYLHDSTLQQFDLTFLFSLLWKLPKKDLVIIESDYKIIAQKIKEGKAHLLSEGDTMYLGACRKGQKGESLVPQPYSDELAPKRAFSLKTSYMRTILPLLVGSKDGSYCNYDKEFQDKALTNIDELKEKTFQEIMINRFSKYHGLNYVELCDVLGITPSTSKSKYFLIASKMAQCSLENAEEIKKSGTTIKTIRVQYDGGIQEHMSFKNLDYGELVENDNWYNSELYELLSGSFMFVVFREKQKGAVVNIDGVEESEYCFDKLVFWTMPQADLLAAEKFWEKARELVIANKITSLRTELSIAKGDIFHIRPKARDSKDLVKNPINGLLTEKNSYWINKSYIKKIIEP